MLLLSVSVTSAADVGKTCFDYLPNMSFFCFIPLLNGKLDIK